MAIKKTKKSIILISVLIIIFILFAVVIPIYYFGKKYDFYNYAKAEIEIPGLNDGFIPQGLCMQDDTNNYLISGYMKNSSNASRIYYVAGEKVSYVTLNTKDANLDNSHFGGIAMQNNMVWVATDGYVLSVNFSDITSSQSGAKVEILNYLQVGINTDFCYARDNILYVGEFYKPKKYEVDKSHYVSISEKETNHGIALCYNINTNSLHGLESTTPIKAISLPDQAQGLCITNSGKVIVSTSYGLADSLIYVYNQPQKEQSQITINNQNLDLYVLSSKNLNNKIVAPCMSEGIDYQNGRVHILFESACKKYRLFTRTRERHVQSVEIE